MRSVPLHRASSAVGVQVLTRASNLVPLWDIRSMLHSDNTQLEMRDLARNKTVFRSVGPLAALEARWWWARFVIGAATSVPVECLQCGMGRSADVDDVLLNAAGALIGALAAGVLVRG